MGKKETNSKAPFGRPLIPPRVTGDFGGRRKTFERRLKRTSIDHYDRRDSDDRRSGYDRRGVKNDQNDQQPPGNRKNDQNISKTDD